MSFNLFRRIPFGVPYSVWEECRSDKQYNKNKERMLGETHLARIPHNPLNPSTIWTVEDVIIAPWTARIVCRNLCQRKSAFVRNKTSNARENQVVEVVFACSRKLSIENQEMIRLAFKSNRWWNKTWSWFGKWKYSRRENLIVISNADEFVGIYYSDSRNNESKGTANNCW